ncbi:MAG: nucleotidyltransferase domain-containing protein [Clostridiales bacterium]|nr:nucleotidyltransferase domain-containing protein [Clostridiales bacterium]
MENSYHVPPRVMKDIIRYASDHNIEKVILFGSRARGDHMERSDIDLAVVGGEFDSFYWDIKEKTHSLLMFDIIDLNKKISAELKAEIMREGITIYEKA